MNIAKVIKAYFVFVMAVSSIALFSYNDNINNYIISVLHADNVSSDNSGFYQSLMGGISYDNYGRKVFTSTLNTSSSLINFNITNHPEKAFIYPGESNKEIMKFDFKTFENDLELKYLKLKIEGIDPQYIEKALILDGKNILQIGKKNREYFVFNDIDYKIENLTKKSLYIYIGVTSDIKTGERFRLDIETPEDIVLTVGGENYIIDSFYPIQGKYLSVVKQRTWGLKKN